MDIIEIELNHRTPNWYERISWWHGQTHTLDLLEQKFTWKFLFSVSGVGSRNVFFTKAPGDSSGKFGKLQFKALCPEICNKGFDS